MDFNILADMSSRPLAFDVSKDLSNFQTSSTEHMMSGESSHQSLFIVTVEMGYQDVLKHLLKKSLKQLALSRSVAHWFLSCDREPSWVACLLRTLINFQNCLESEGLFAKFFCLAWRS